MARLIDSDVIIEMERRGLGVEVLPEIMASDEEVALAAVTVAEVVVGIERVGSDIRRHRRETFLDRLLATIPVFPFGVAEARTYGRLLAELAARGQPIGPHDAQIAATAMTHGYGVLTANVSHFQRVPGLSVAVPRWP